MGKCPNCQAFGTLHEVEKTSVRASGIEASTPVRKASKLSDLKSSPITRRETGIYEFDRVLGGGFVDSEVVLFGGSPGAGKSTLSLRVAEKFADNGLTVLYASGEESEQQIAMRASRMNIDSDIIHVVNENDLGAILGHIEAIQPDFVIVDSLQTVTSSGGSASSVSQSKEAAHVLTTVAKTQGITMLLVNQVVKNGEFAGSEAIQHIVDCSLILESDSETPLKFLRTTKNRFGETTEVGVFQHSETGLEEVSDPSGIFLDNDESSVIGASCSFMNEGIRNIPVEIQALVTKSTLAQPRRQFNGINFQRGQIVCAILEKFCNAKLYENDVFVSTVSGVKVSDPQSDLAVAMSILSSLKGFQIDTSSAFIGELSLTGQVRGSFMIENKMKEAARLGFTTIYVPKTAKLSPPSNISVIAVSTVKEMYQKIQKTS